MKIRNVVLMGALLASVAACTYVPAGNVGVKVNLYGSDKGVNVEEVGPGKYWLGWNEEMYLFPTFMQNYVWTASTTEGSPTDESFSFQTMDGMVANADIGISYSIDPEHVTEIFQKYRKGVDEITDVYLHNMVRDALVKEASTKPVDYVYGAGKADLIAAVQKDVMEQVDAIGIKIDKISWIGEIRLPQTVIDSINAKNAATQMAQQRQNEVAQAKAEAEKRVATAKGEADSILLTAQAQAEANKVLAQSLTPEFVEYQAITKWDGKLPTMTGSSAVPFIDVTKQVTPQQ